ncbi:hypothetical protein Pint_36703 [Pistacia integerrima]|uniref:Uncharacterized protein n=1 Tax=Pistacia integerrima TaxID=434235 RepID=A0ACC0Y2N1_9ROSI|nr:hypothetical protein Pint_36703 [Pistacia integerrima]
MEAERDLKSKQCDVEKEIEAVERNDERIKATVQDWLSDSRKIMGEVETLKGKIEVNKTCLNGWCPNWVSRHQLGRKATKTSIRLKKVILDGGQFESVGRRALLSGEPSAPKDPAPLSGEPSAPKDPAPLSGEPSAPKDLAPLSEEHEGVELLKRQAGIDDDCDDLTTLATRIASECYGLPLAIVTTGRLVCPKLKILLLGGEKQWLPYKYDKSKLLKVSDECFEEMKALEVVSLRYADLSLKSLQFLTNLKTLELSHCNLRDIYFLAKLNKLEILTFRAGLIQLKNLEIEDAAELKQVFHGKEENEVAEDGKDIKLPNLKELKLYRLEKLTRFFPENNHSTLPALEKFKMIECPNLKIKEGDLNELIVRSNSELEEIFGDNDVIDEKEIQLPQLKKMTLEDLPRLTNFCHMDYHFIFPKPPLFWLKVKRCPKISTRFSWDEENKRVHAEAKAPKIGSQDGSHQEQAPEIGSEDKSHEETSTDLFCGGSFENLPPYMKDEEKNTET